VPQDSRILLRVGIHLGDMIVEGDDLYGDGVNIAARLEALAEPGALPTDFHVVVDSYPLQDQEAARSVVLPVDIVRSLGRHYAAITSR
jgi:adenylate cyclase